ncbi:hypothetical protein TraAM80_07920 [Trypanosoma rangeli]|uniref:Uncharacterized protein n=1 Tax=Trypanosoma rangeli TaxID=5698 RepID=A0A3R7RCS4_TRYRA|nr:uncharacterized protein TraAM80_07920 [Trypanosoma rangeli]RNE99904.1 hypothetical protein TraAM80_07920 [Trypanosoma rangeli]|eukprot:RNE99904.1 hypothetical protein TraAM80_07920 [Trypanosoma rangeli]
MTYSGVTQASLGQYVSPTLRPTNPWAQQIFTGTFRPPNPLAYCLPHEKGEQAVTEESVFRFSSFSSGHCSMLADQTQSHAYYGEDSSYTMERIMSMVVSAVGQERDKFAALQEGNHVLEQELKQVQMRREEAQRTLREFGHLSLSLAAFHQEQLQLLQELQQQ